MLSDAPAHHIFCLLGPVDPTSNSLPEVLSVLQVGVAVITLIIRISFLYYHCTKHQHSGSKDGRWLLFLYGKKVDEVFIQS